jgi:membrane fusion protein (multidrug efflux system)
VFAIGQERNLSAALNDTRRIASAAALATVLLLGACGGGGGADKGQQKAGGRGGAPGQGTPQVGYVVARPTAAALTTELSGRTAAFEMSDVRPQVNGIVRRRLFTEGALVRQGQPLYEIDPRLYRAASNQAQANLRSAQATAEAARIQAERYRPLAQIEAVSRQDLTNAVAQARQAQASVAQNQAALETARINLQFTTVSAPISGRIGRSLFTVGALVSASQADPLAQIQRLDPMFVDIQQSAADMLGLRRSLSTGGITATTAQVHLTLEDGSDYGYTGTVEFTEALVDQATGTVTLRARFPNPRGVLLPGMFVRASFAQGINAQAFLVPQQALNRDPQGNATVMVVGPGNKVAQKKVQAERTQGPYWVVTSGLATGDKIITQGLSKLRPGQGIKPVPANSPQRIQPPGGKNGRSGAPTQSGGDRGNTGRSGQDKAS